MNNRKNTSLPANHRLRALLGIAALSFAAIFCQSTPSETPPSGDLPTPQIPQAEPVAVNLIVYQGTDGNIYTIDENGQNSTAVTNDGDIFGQNGAQKLYRFPTWSPDSTRIAFSSLINDFADSSSAGIHVASPTGEDRLDVFESLLAFPIYLYWTPDSEKISFLSNASGSGSLEAFAPPVNNGTLARVRAQSNTLALQLVAADGSTPARVVDQGQPYYWSWAPDSSQYFAHVGSAIFLNPEARLSVLTPLGDPPVKLSAAPSLFRAPHWSPDGDRLLFARFDSGTNVTELVSTNLEGFGSQILYELDNSSAFNWSPDGKHVALVVNTQVVVQETLGSLEIIEIENSANRVLVEEADVVAYYWAPDGTKLAYFTFRTEAADGSENLEFAINVYDLENGEKQSFVFTPTREFVNTVIPFFDQYHHSTTIWSPDSTKIVIALRDGDNSTVQVIDINSEFIPQRIADGILAFWSWK